jgi:hypothetical protein
MEVVLLPAKLSGRLPMLKNSGYNLTQLMCMRGHSASLPKLFSTYDHKKTVLMMIRLDNEEAAHIPIFRLALFIGNEF